MVAYFDCYRVGTITRQIASVGHFIQQTVDSCRRQLNTYTLHIILASLLISLKYLNLILITVRGLSSFEYQNNAGTRKVVYDIVLTGIARVAM